MNLIASQKQRLAIQKASNWFDILFNSVSKYLISTFQRQFN